jgi:hypothetical protein
MTDLIDDHGYPLISIGLPDHLGEAAAERRHRMTVGTEAGRSLLARESLNSRSFTLIEPDAIAAIESEARAAALREVAEKVRALPATDSLIGYCYNAEQVLAILTEATDTSATRAVGASE